MTAIFSTDNGSLKRSSKRRVVFTCLFGYSEAFANHRYVDDLTDFICFTDDKSLRSDVWTFRYMDPGQLGPVRTAKMPKILPHRFLDGYEASLYLDNTTVLTAPVGNVFAFLDQSTSPMVCFRHSERSCVYQEADKVIEFGYDDEAVVRQQMSHYRATGYPVDAGLIFGGVLLRRHNDPMLKAVMEAWFDQVLRHSYRDQLSFNVVAHRMRFAPDYFPGSPVENELVRWPLLPGGVRLPRGFRDDAYLELHEDVRRAGMNPREHYLKYGIAEGRSYLPSKSQEQT
jgi:hypothetical protein